MNVIDWLKVAVCSLPLAPLAFAALPPLSPKMLDNAANLVAEGTVEKVEHKVVDVEGGNDLQYSAVLELEKLEKGPVFAGAKTITVRFRRTGKRPPGWAGPQGQNSVPAVGERIRVYARLGSDGFFHLLEPNGWTRSP